MSWVGGHIHLVRNSTYGLVLKNQGRAVKCNPVSAKALRKERLGSMRGTGRRLRWMVQSEEGRGVIQDEFGDDLWIQRVEKKRRECSWGGVGGSVSTVSDLEGLI